MEKKKLFLTTLSVICILVVLMLSVSAIGVYCDGISRRSTDPGAYIYTREIALSKILPGMMLAFAGLGMAVTCIILGIKDEGAVKPVMDARYVKDTFVIKPERLKLIRISVLALAVIFIIAGIVNGNMAAILIKAINICTECIGLG